MGNSQSLDSTVIKHIKMYVVRLKRNPVLDCTYRFILLFSLLYGLWHAQFHIQLGFVIYGFVRLFCFITLLNTFSTVACFFSILCHLCILYIHFLHSLVTHVDLYGYPVCALVL